jgi:hypothetical protein
MSKSTSAASSSHAASPLLFKSLTKRLQNPLETGQKIQIQLLPMSGDPAWNCNHGEGQVLNFKETQVYLSKIRRILSRKGGRMALDNPSSTNAPLRSCKKLAVDIFCSTFCLLEPAAIQ